MAELTAEQITRLLIGIAKAQTAVVRGLAKADRAVSMNVITELQGAVGIGSNPRPPLTLETLPAQILLSSMGTPGPTATPLEQWIQTELSKLLG